MLHRQHKVKKFPFVMVSVQKCTSNQNKKTICTVPSYGLGRKKWLRMWTKGTKLRQKSPEHYLSWHIISRITRNRSNGNFWNSGCCSLPWRQRSIWKHVRSKGSINDVSYPPTHFKSEFEHDDTAELLMISLGSVSYKRDWKLSLRRCRRFKPSVK